MPNAFASASRDFMDGYHNSNNECKLNGLYPYNPGKRATCFFGRDQKDTPMILDTDFKGRRTPS